jgi:hypothetical protein
VRAAPASIAVQLGLLPQPALASLLDSNMYTFVLVCVVCVN